MSQPASTPTDDQPSKSNRPLVQVKNLKTYYEDSGLFKNDPVKAVDGVSFDIKKGETLGLVGESGCGKTTLGRTLLRLEEPTDGSVYYEGEDITEFSRGELHEWRRNAMMMYQDPDSSLNDRMTIGEIVREPLDVHEWGSKRERRERVRDLLETVGLQREHYYRYPHQFSGGQRQRIGIARTLSLEPDFIVLDEPVSALDVSVQAEIINLLEDLQDEFGLTYLFIAHDLSVVRHICDRVAVMYLGHVMEIGPTEELFTDPANPYTYSLLSAIPEPDPTSDKERVTLHGTPPNPRYPPDGCPFSTRCPARIRPDEYEDLDDELWSRLNTLREILQERKRADRSIRERIREGLGSKTRFGTIDAVYEELFGDQDVPDRIGPTLKTIADHARNNDEAQAVERFDEAFGSVCNGNSEDVEADAKQEPISPEYYTVSDTGRQSYCHRHDGSHDDPATVIQRRNE